MPGQSKAGPWVFGIVATGLSAGSALAQTAADAPKVTSLQEVVVTANKRAENVQDVPITLSVVTPRQMQNQNITTTDQLIKLSPTLAFTPSFVPGFNTFIVRGVGTFSTSTGLDTSVGVSIDSVPVARVIGSVTSLVDLDHVEILNGPQGMLFGKNASAGLITLTTRNPQLDELSGNVHAVVGNFKTVNLSGTANVPIGSTAAVRLSAWRFKHGSIGESVRTGQGFGNEDTWGGRVKFRWRPTEKLDLNLTAEQSEASDNGVLTTDRFILPTSIFFGPERAQGIVPSNTNRRNTVGDDQHVQTKIKFLVGRADYDLGFATLTSISSWRRTTFDLYVVPYSQTNPGLPFVNSDEEHASESVTQEVRLTSATKGRLQYVAGLFVSKLDIGLSQNQVIRGILPINVGFHELQTAHSENMAAFVQATYDVTDSLRLIAGGRLSRDKINAKLVRENTAVGQPSVPALNGPGAQYGFFSATTSAGDETPSWRLGVQYRLTPDVMTYATVTRGYKGAGASLGGATATTIALTGNIVRPEIATNYEAGIRSSWLDGRLTANASVFSTTFKDFQVTARITPDLPSTNVVNAPELKSEGAQADVRVRPIEGLQLSATVAYTDARYTKFPFAPCTAQPGSPLPPCRPAPLNATQDLAGFSLSNSPKWSAVLEGSYERDFGGLKGTFDFNFRYKSRVVFNLSHNPVEAQGGYGVLNIGAALSSPDDRWRVRAYGNNITGQHYVNRISPQPLGFWSNVFDIGAFRTYGVSVDYNF